MVEEAAGPAALSVGSAPTFEESSGIIGSGPRSAMEAHLVDFDGDLYGHTVTIAFTRRLRDQQRFPDTGALSRQIARDVEDVRAGYRDAQLTGVPL
jgi:riboflavin kinase/FMN adenylyltransferase